MDHLQKTEVRLLIEGRRGAIHTHRRIPHPSKGKKEKGIPSRYNTWNRCYYFIFSNNSDFMLFYGLAKKKRNIFFVGAYMFCDDEGKIGSRSSRGLFLPEALQGLVGLGGQKRATEAGDHAADFFHSTSKLMSVESVHNIQEREWEREWKRELC